MSDPRPGSAAPRPRPVTVAGVIAASACGLLVISLFDAMSQVRSAQMRADVARMLAGQSGLGLRAGDVIGILRGVVLLSAALAAAGLVLAIYALQRHRAARVGLTVVAVVLLFTATLLTGLLPLLLAAAAGRLWRKDARVWYDERPARPVTDPPPPEAAPPLSPPPTGRGPYPGPPPVSYGGRLPPQQQVLAPPQRAPSPTRPASVRIAAWLTWVSCGVSTVFFGLLALVLVADQGRLVEALLRNPQVAGAGLSRQQVLGVLWVLAAVGIAWSLAAIALAVLAFRRVNAGRIALVVSALLAGVVGLIAVPVGWLHGAAAFATAALLLSGGARPWYAGRGPDNRPPARPPA